MTGDSRRYSVSPSREHFCEFFRRQKVFCFQKLIKIFQTIRAFHSRLFGEWHSCLQTVQPMTSFKAMHLVRTRLE